MRIVTILLLHFVLPFTACNEQHGQADEKHNHRTRTIAIGDTVSALGSDIGCILQDRNGVYWFGSNGGGVYRYDGKTLQHITDKHGLCSNTVLNIQQDGNGILWFTTHHGFCRYDGTAFIDMTTSITNALPGIPRFRQDGLFFPHSNGICYYDGQSFINFAIHPATYHPSPGDNNRPYSVYSSWIDKSGNAWFGMQSMGVRRYGKGEVSSLTEKHLVGPAVRAAFQDSGGVLWFGNNGGGLYRYDGQTLRNITEEQGLGNPEFLSGRFIDKPGSLARVWAINQDREGDLWIGTIDAGLWRYDGMEFTNYTTNDGLPGNAVWAIHKNNAGELLFITDGTAISRFDGEHFIPFTFGR